MRLSNYSVSFPVSAFAQFGRTLPTNGVTGLCALKSLHSMGLTTPDSIAFVTFDELIAEDFFQPRITSVVQPTYEIGHRAGEVLFDRIKPDEANANPPSGHYTSCCRR